MKRIMLVLAAMATLALLAGTAWADTASYTTGGNSPFKLVRHTTHYGGHYGYYPSYYTFHDRYRYGSRSSCKPYVYRGYYPRHHVYYGHPSGFYYGRPRVGFSIGF